MRDPGLWREACVKFSPQQGWGNFRKILSDNVFLPSSKIHNIQSKTVMVKFTRLQKLIHYYSALPHTFIKLRNRESLV